MTERRLSWLDYGIATDISDDGKTIAIMDTGAASGVSDLGYVRATDGSPAVKLGTWTDERLSPDGKRVIAVDGSDVTSARLAIVPVGAGQIQTLPSNGMQTVVSECDESGGGSEAGTVCVPVVVQSCGLPGGVLPDRNSGSKNPFPSFGTLKGDAIDSSDPNSHSRGDPLPPDPLRSKPSNPLRVQNLSWPPQALALCAGIS